MIGRQPFSKFIFNPFHQSAGGAHGAPHKSLMVKARRSKSSHVNPSQSLCSFSSRSKRVQ
jgi:hypothetical protein